MRRSVDVDEPLITVKGTAKVTSNFRSVRFRVGVCAFAVNGPEAKKAARPTIDKIQQVIRTFAEKARIDTDHLQSRFDVVPIHRTDPMTYETKVNGYRADYSLEFICFILEQAVDLHDALTSIEGVRANSPEFLFSETDISGQKGFEEAVKSAKRAFELQCRALELDPKQYEIVHWELTDAEPSHAGKSMALSRDQSVTHGVTPGTGVFEIAVNVSYRHI